MQIMRALISSAAEAELGALYINAKEAIYAAKILEALGHKQPQIPMITDNSTVWNIAQTYQGHGLKVSLVESTQGARAFPFLLTPWSRQ